MAGDAAREARAAQLRTYHAAKQRQEWLASEEAAEEAKWPGLNANERQTLKDRVGRAPQHPAPRKMCGSRGLSGPVDAKWDREVRAFAAKVAETYRTMLEKKRIVAASPVPVPTEAVVQVAATTRPRQRAQLTVRRPKQIWWVADEPDDGEAARDPGDGWINDEDLCKCSSREVIHDYWLGCRAKTFDGRNIRGGCDCFNCYEFHSVPCNLRYDQRPPLVYEDRDAWAAAARASASAPVPVLTEAVVQVPAEIRHSSIRSRSPIRSPSRSPIRSPSPPPDTRQERRVLRRKEGQESELEERIMRGFELRRLERSVMPATREGGRKRRRAQ